MINRVILRRFKRFGEETFDLPGHIVLAGPNNSGKTTMLQAVAAWDLALTRWKELNNFQRRGGAYPYAPIARQTFAAVPLRSFDLLWNNRAYTGHIEIELRSDAGWNITMEIISNTTEQVFVRPTRDVEPPVLRETTLQTVFIPPMTGLSTEEPVYTAPKQKQLLGQARPGEILRNLLVTAHQIAAWEELRSAIDVLFDYELHPPDATGANILAEYSPRGSNTRFDIASAGSGFQQVLLLLTLLYTNPASLLLIDEPDAHLHVLLQDSIYSKLRAVAASRNSQLIVSTHSEVIIDSVEPKELCMMLGHPRVLETTAQRDKLSEALRYLTNTDVMLALNAPGILYLEGHTDLNLLREFARILNHPLYPHLAKNVFWKPKEISNRMGASGLPSQAHFEILKLVRVDIRGVELVDGDEHRGIQSTEYEAGKLQRLRWKRYEIESYLAVPNALDRFIEHTLGGAEASAEAKAAAREAWKNLFGSTELAEAFAADPINPPRLIESFLESTKARRDIIPVLLTAAGIHGFEYTRYSEIAAVMTADEVHPEVREKLDAIQQAFGL